MGNAGNNVAAEPMESDGTFDQSKLEQQFNRAFDTFKGEVSTLGSGRADAAMFNHITVEAYGGRQPLSTVGQVVLQSERQIVVNVYDAMLKKPVADALAAADLDLNPLIEGNSVVVPIPKTTKESREKMAKVAAQHAEKAKQRLRGLRRDGIAQVKTMKTDGDITEDEFYTFQKQIQGVADSYTKEVSELLKAKEKAILAP